MKDFYIDISKNKISKKADQIILVLGNYLCLYIKINNKFKKIIETDCYYGKNGFSINRHSGDLTTPIGAYKILYAFGTDGNINTNIEYKKITQNSYFSDDENNIEQYNTWIESNKKIIGEHLIEYPKEYHYGMVIGYNINPKVKGKGSSIFLHCKGNKPYTAGCIAIDECKLLEVLKNIDKREAYILIVPNKDFLKLY